MQVVCVHGVYCGAHINYKSKSTAQNVPGVKRKFKKNYVPDSQTANYSPSVRMMELTDGRLGDTRDHQR